MKVPGKAWLQFEVKAQDGDPRPLLTQTAFFAPKGLSGLAYWYLLYPIHGMIRRLAERAISIASSPLHNIDHDRLAGIAWGSFIAATLMSRSVTGSSLPSTRAAALRESAPAATSHRLSALAAP
jgi:hypothetical protein